jgi:hypothetical protein
MFLAADLEQKSDRHPYLAECADDLKTPVIILIDATNFEVAAL